MMEPLALDFDATGTQSVPLDLASALNPTPVPEPAVASDRASKAAYGVQGMSDQTYPDILDKIQSGQEKDIRFKLATDLSYFKQTQVEKDIQSRAADGSLTMPYLIQAAQTYAIDPELVVEKTFPNRFMDNMFSTNLANSMMSEEFPKNPELLNAALNMGKDFAAKEQYVTRRLQDGSVEIQQKGWLKWLGDFLASNIPGVTSYNLRKGIMGLEQGDTSLQGIERYGLGANLEAQRRELYNLPIDQFGPIFDKIRSSITNLQLREEFDKAMLGQSLQEQRMRTLGEGLDALMIGELGVKTATSIASRIAMRNAILDLTRATRAAETRPITTAAEAGLGRVDRAGINQQTVDLTREIGGDTGAATKNAIHGLSSVDNFDLDIGVRSGNYGQEVANRIRDWVDTNTERFINLITNSTSLKINRTPALALEEVQQKVFAYIKENFKGPSNSVINVNNLRWEPASNTYHVDIHIGTPDGTMHSAEQLARNYAHELGINLVPNAGNIASVYPNFTSFRLAMRKLGVDVKTTGITNSIEFERAKKLEQGAVTATNGATIEQQGTNWYIKATVPVRDISVRNYLLELADTNLPNKRFASLSNYLGYVRSAADTLSIEERQARNIAAQVPAAYRAIMQDLLKPMNNLSRESVGPFNRLLTDGQANARYFTNTLDLNNWYQTNIGRLANEAEIKAYASYYRAAQLDKTMREIGIQRNLWKSGAEEHSFKLKMPDGELIDSPKFNGKTLKVIPPDRDGTILLVDPDPTKTKVALIKDLGGKLKILNESLEKGELQLVQIHAPEKFPLRGLIFHEVNEPRIQYVVAPAFRTNPVPWGQMGKIKHHFMPEYDHYVSKARINPETIGKTTYNWYDGDIHLGGVNNRAMGAVFAKHITEAQRLLADGDEAAARAYVSQHTSVDPDKFVGWYRPSTTPEGVTLPPKLTLDKEPFQVVRNGSFIQDVDNTLQDRFPGTFRDGTREGSLRQNINLEYQGSQANELYAITDVGTRSNPIMSLDKPTIIDPITSLNRGIGKVIDTLFMDDYKSFVAEHWFQQARPWLLQPDNHSPYWHMYNPRWNSNMPQEIKAQLMDNLGKAMQFISAPSWWDTITHSVSNAVADSLYKGAGPKIVPLSRIPLITSPAQILRSFATHSVLGVFSVKQFFNNMSTWTNILAFSPRSTPAATTATMLYGLTRFNKAPAFLDKLDSIAVNAAIPGASALFHEWRPGWLKEAFNLLDENGFANVSAEHAFTQGILADKIVSRGFNKLTDAGLAPWRLGAEGIRTTAFLTAYMERKIAEPAISWGRKNLQELLDRAHTLDHNMSKASSSRLNTVPLLSNATQFMSYEMRLSELMLGTRITKAEKLRWLFVNSMLYGVPSSLGVMMLPVGDWVRKAAIEHLGYVPGENVTSTVAGEGLLGAATGQDVSKFGLRGIFENMFKTDKTIWDILGGASYQMASTLTQSLIPFYRAGSDWIKGEGAFKVTPEHFLKAAETISSISDGHRLITAWNTGDWISRNNTLLESKTVDPLRAFMQTVFGTQPLHVKHGYTLSEISKARLEQQRDAEKLALKEIHYAYRTSDPTMSKQYFTNALSFLQAAGYSDDQYASFWASAAKQNEEFIDKVAWEYATKHVPEGQRGKLMDYYQRALRAMRPQ